VKHKREALGISATELARRSGVTTGTVTRLELEQIAEPNGSTLRALARELKLPATDLFVLAAWIPPHELPSLTTYLRSKYGDLPQAAAHEIEELLSQVRGVARPSELELSDTN
jgi:transcriptional regulator with XRE-family HTH domain